MNTPKKIVRAVVGVAMRAAVVAGAALLVQLTVWDGTGKRLPLGLLIACFFVVPFATRRAR